MPSAREILSSVVMTAVGVAIIFRVDFLREIVSGLKADPAAVGSAPGTKRTVYI